jgi:quercetin dioxygenase-like cupin family protein
MKDTANTNRDDHPRLPELANSMLPLPFDLSKEIEKLHTKESWTRETGRSSETLVKYKNFRVVLIAMKANTHISEHRAQRPISIQAVQGRICIHVGGQKIELGAGGLLTLDGGLDHGVQSLEESAFLLTLATE